MNDLFVTYEQALDLKVLGFDEPCFGAYRSHSHFIGHLDIQYCTTNNLKQYEWLLHTLAPLKSQVFKWFRDKHQLFGEVVCDTTTEPKFCYVVHEFFGNPDDLTEKEWGWKDGLYSVLYRKHDQAETELIDYLIQKLKVI